MIDRQNIVNAVAGRNVAISPDEHRIVVMLLARERGWGLTRISDWTNHGRSTVAAILAKQKGIKP